MISRANPRFWKAYRTLPAEVKTRAREAYRIFAADPRHPNLRFKKVHPELPIYSARIDRNHRAIGVLKGETIIWFWVGDHEEYERVLKNA